MKAQAGYRWFLARVGLILVGGAVIFGAFLAIALAADTSTPAVTAGVGMADRNVVGSFGIIGAPPLTVKPTAATPSFIADPLNEKRGVILLIYVKNSTDDEEMLSYFNQIKAQYSAQGSFFSFEAHNVSDVGDMLDQLKISQPPALAVISGDGNVYQEYTGWIGEKVMEQVVSNALRQ